MIANKSLILKAVTEFRLKVRKSQEGPFTSGKLFRGNTQKPSHRCRQPHFPNSSVQNDRKS